MTDFRNLVIVGALVVFGFASSAKAENCLQRFSCELYGECRLPCFDDGAAKAEASPALPPQDAVASRTPPTLPAAASPTPSQKPIKVARRPRHPEIVRVIAGKAIQSLDDLAGKPVSFGLKGDPFQAIGRRAFAQVGIKVRETPLDLDNALDGISTGDVAAVVVIDSLDAEKLNHLRATNLHLLPIPAGRSVPDGMRKAVIPPGDIPAVTHGEAVETLALTVHDKRGARPLLASAR